MITLRSFSESSASEKINFKEAFLMLAEFDRINNSKEFTLVCELETTKKKSVSIRFFTKNHVDWFIDTNFFGRDGHFAIANVTEVFTCIALGLPAAIQVYQHDFSIRIIPGTIQKIRD